MSRIKAPFTPEQVEALNRWQRNRALHPFTCGRNRTDARHVAYAEKHGEHDLGILIASRDGWKCPACGYTQDWAHGFMAEIPDADKETQR